MTNTDPEAFAALERVDSRLTFISFVRALRAELEESNRREAVSPSSSYGPQALEWENPTLPAFLEAMEAWGTDSAAGRAAAEPSWRGFAEFLWAAKMYE